MILVTVTRDLQERVAAGEQSPQRAALPGGAPAGLIRVERPRVADPPEQVLIRLGERFAARGEDRVDTAAGPAGAEQLFAELDHVAARDTVAHRRCDQRRLQPRAEATRGDLRWQLRTRLTPTGRAANRWARCSITPTVSSSSSSTWWQDRRPRSASRSRSRTRARSRSARASARPPHPPRTLATDRGRGPRARAVPRGRAQRNPGPRSGAFLGGSELGGAEEFRELRFSRRSNWAIRSSWRATRASSRPTCSSIRSRTATTTSRPWS